MALRLRRLKITRFRDVRPGTELRFNDEWNVVLGHNATGKTTLLNLVSMALRGDFEELRDESFELEYDIEGSGWSATFSMARDFAQAQQTAGPPGFDPNPFRLSFMWCSVVVRVGAEVFVIAVEPQTEAGQIPVAVAPPPDALELSVSGYVTVGFLRGKQALRVPAEELVAARSYRFDEALGLFRRIHRESDDGLGLPRLMKAAVIRMQDRETFNLSLVPANVTTLFDRSEQEIVSVRASFAECMRLREITARLGGTSLSAVWPAEKVDRVGEQTLTVLGAPTILLHRADGTAMPVKQLSFGQKRLFTFAWYLDSNPGPVVADELVNGMHYEWIDECVRAMEGRQKFLTAQNPLLLDHVDIASEEDVMRSFILCRAETTDGRRQVVWANPTGEQAAEFFRAYQNGVLRVHEILRTEGLW